MLTDLPLPLPSYLLTPMSAVSSSSRPSRLFSCLKMEVALLRVRIWKDHPGGKFGIVPVSTLLWRFEQTKRNRVSEKSNCRQFTMVLKPCMLFLMLSPPRIAYPGLSHSLCATSHTKGFSFLKQVSRLSVRLFLSSQDYSGLGIVRAHHFSSP